MSEQGSRPVPPPRLAERGVVPLDQLWSRLTPERRRQTLHLLSNVVARRIEPLLRKEADDERHLS